MTSDQPPAYDAPANADGLPSYEYSTTHSTTPQHGEALPTFVLDGRRIYSRLQPGRTLYNLNQPPVEATATLYSVSKTRYKTSPSHRGGERTREDHLYDFFSDYLSIGLRDISVLGRAGPRRSFLDVDMMQGTGPSSFRVAGHFKTDRSLRDRLQRGSEIAWRRVEDGEVVAVETKIGRKGEGLPRLEVKMALEEKEIDLLVTCWCARVWRQVGG